MSFGLVIYLRQWLKPHFSRNGGCFIVEFGPLMLMRLDFPGKALDVSLQLSWREK